MGAKKALLDADPDSRTDVTRLPARHGTLRLAILTGQDSPTTCLWISRLADLPDVRIAGILLGSQPACLPIKLRNLRWNNRRQGASYLFPRLARRLNDALDRVALRLVTPSAVLTLLGKAL